MLLIDRQVRLAFTAPLLFLVASCASKPVPNASPAAPSAEWCSNAPPGAQAFDTSRLRELAGRYELLMVGDNETSAGHRDLGVLTFWPPDSAAGTSIALGHPISLWASFERTPPDTSAYARRMASRDPASPGGRMFRGFIELGDFGWLDGTSHGLLPAWGDPSLFGGRWGRDLGIAVITDRLGRRLPNPGGYFCARRLGPS